MPPLPAFERLLAALQRLPGIGPRSSRRIGHWILSASEAEAGAFVEAVRLARERVVACGACHALTEEEPCRFCSDPGRDGRVVAVVEEAADVEVLERTREFRGRYHVLGGALAPLKGIGPDELNVADLVARVAAGGIEEVLLATNPTTEGEATALYLARRLKPLGARVTRLALGLPVGAALEFADDVTLSRSLSGRKEV